MTAPFQVFSYYLMGLGIKTIVLQNFPDIGILPMLETSMLDSFALDAFLGCVQLRRVELYDNLWIRAIRHNVNLLTST